MRFSRPMLRGILLSRYKRFLADVRLEDGRTLTVHCPNSGSMKACSEPGRQVIISDSQNPKRKLRYTLEMIRMGTSWVGLHSALANPFVADLVRRGRIPELEGYARVQREVVAPDSARSGGAASRIDLYLSEHPKRPDCWVEIKHSTMRVARHAAFPDAVTERGRKHLNTLRARVASGERAAIFFLVGRGDCNRFRPADEIDPEYGATLRAVFDDGVEILAYRARFSPERVQLVDRLPVDL